MFPMKADLQELMITLGEIKHITGKRYIVLEGYYAFQSKRYWWYKREMG